MPAHFFLIHKSPLTLQYPTAAYYVPGIQKGDNVCSTQKYEFPDNAERCIINNASAISPRVSVSPPPPRRWQWHGTPAAIVPLLGRGQETESPTLVVVVGRDSGGCFQISVRSIRPIDMDERPLKLELSYRCLA